LIASNSGFGGRGTVEHGLRFTIAVAAPPLETASRP
jgi:hypothetical protein